MRKRIFFILLALLMLGTIGFFYVHNILLPVKVKEFIELRAQDYLQRKIDIEDIDFKSLKGFSLVNIKIYKKNSDKELFFHADEIRFNILFAALFKQRAVIIPSLYIEKPSMHLIREATGKWSFSDMFEAEGLEGEDNLYTFILRKISIHAGEIDYTDLTQEEDFFESLQNVNLTAHISLNTSIQYEFTSVLPLKAASIAAKGELSPISKNIISTIAFKNLPLSDYVSLYKQNSSINIIELVGSSPQLKLHYQDGSLGLQGNLEISTSNVQSETWSYQGPLAIKDMNLYLKNNDISFNGKLLSPSAQFSWQTTKSFKGQFEIDLENFELQKEKRIFKGNAKFAQAQIDLGEGKTLQGNFNLEQFVLTMDDRTAGSFKSATIGNAQIELNDQSLKGDIAFNRGNMIILPGDFSVDTSFSVENGDLRLKHNRRLQTQLNASAFSARIKDQSIFLDADLAFSNTTAALDSKRSFSGNPKLEIKLTYPLSKEKQFSTQGQLVLDGASMLGLPPIEKAENLIGNISFFTNKLTTDSLSFDALNTTFRAKGSWEGWVKPILDVQFGTDTIELNSINALFPAIGEKYNIVPSGLASLNAQYKGSLKPISLKNAAFALTLKNVNLDLKNSDKDVFDIVGDIKYGNDKLTWSDGSLTFLDKKIVTDGSFDLAQNSISTEIKTADLDAQAQLSYLDERFHIDMLKGRYSFTTFDAVGSFDLNKNISIDANGTFHLEDLPKLPPHIYEKLKNVNPLGQLKWKGDYAGRMDNWKEAQIDFIARTNTMRLLHYPLDDVRITYRQNAGTIELFNFTAQLYEGSLNIQGDGNLMVDNIPFNSLTKFISMDLTAYRKDKGSKNRYLSGKLSTAFTMAGALLKPESYEGAGKLEITEAYLGQLVPQLNEAIYKEAEADFIIRNRKIYTDNGVIRSDSIDLLAKGWVDFDKKLNLEIIPSIKLKESQMIDTGHVKINPAPLLTNAVSLRMTGTIDKPIKEVNTSPANVIKNTTDVLKEGLKGVGSILEDLF